MKIYNKFVESKKEPYNKSDIWFDGSSWKMYKEGMWRPFTISLEQAQALYEYVEGFKLFKIVDTLPEIGQDNTIYLVENKDSIEGNSLIEYIHINNKWEEVGKFTPEINLDDYAKKSDIVQADYNQSDSTAKDYINNRPCYIEQINIDTKDIVWDDMNGNGTIQLSQLGTITIYFNDVTDGAFGPLILNEQNEYRGIIYASDSSWEVYLNTEDFVLTLIDYNLSGSSIVSITQDILKQLDEQYIPATIARQSEITRLENRIKELENLLNK